MRIIFEGNPDEIGLLLRSIYPNTSEQKSLIKNDVFSFKDVLGQTRVEFKERNPSLAGELNCLRKDIQNSLIPTGKPVGLPSNP